MIEMTFIMLFVRTKLHRLTFLLTWGRPNNDQLRLRLDQRNNFSLNSTQLETRCEWHEVEIATENLCRLRGSRLNAIRCRCAEHHNAKKTNIMPSRPSPRQSPPQTAFRAKSRDRRGSFHFHLCINFGKSRCENEMRDSRWSEIAMHECPAHRKRRKFN